MGNLFEYGHVPTYDAFQYNNDVEVGSLLSEITRIVLQKQRLGVYYKEFSGKNLKIKQQFILRLSRVLSGVFSENEVHLSWMMIQGDAVIEDFYKSTIANVSEIWFNDEKTNEPEVVSKLLSIYNLNDKDIDAYIVEDLLPIFARIESEKIIVLVYDLQTFNNDVFQEKIHTLSKRISQYLKERNIIFFVLGNTTLKSSQIKISEPDKKTLKKWESIIPNNFSSPNTLSSDKIESLIFENIGWLKPLSLISHPASKEMVDFIRSYYDQLDDRLKVLGQYQIISFLENSNIALNSKYINLIRDISYSTKIRDEHLVALGLSGTGLSSKSNLENLIERFGESKEQWKVINSYFQAHGSTALALGIKKESKLCDWHIESVNEVINEEGFIKNPMQIRAMMDYTGQILLSTQNTLSLKNKQHFIGLLERVADRYTSYLRSRSDINPEMQLEASRYQYKVGHVYDRLFNKDRYDVKNRERTISYQSAANSLDIPDINSPLFETIIYRKGTSLSKVNKRLGFELYEKYANELYQKQLNIESNNIFKKANTWLLSSEELMSYAICTNYLTNREQLKKSFSKIINNLITRTGCRFNEEQYINTILSPQIPTFRNVLLNKDNVPFDVSIYVGLSDIHTALIISENIFSETLISPKINLISNKNGLVFNKNKDDKFQIIIGAPDTPDGVGETVITYDNVLERTYHLKMAYDFSEPVIINKFNCQALVLCASGINGIINAWSKVQSKFVNNIKQSIKMESFIITPLLMALLKRIGSKSIDLLFDKIVQKKTNKESTAKEILVEKITKQEKQINRTELLEILKELEPIDRNNIINAIQEEKKSIEMVIDGIVNRLDIDEGIEDLLIYTKSLYEFSKDIENMEITANKRDILQSYIKGFHLRYDRVKNIEKNFLTLGELNKKSIAKEKVLLNSQIINFKKFVATLQ